MHPKACFINSTEQELLSLIQQYPLATMLLPLDKQVFPHSSHLPFYLDNNNEQLLGHCSNHHPLAHQLTSNRLNKEVKIQLIFNGENDYISPNYSKELIVPTWNYSAVHIQGQVQLITEYREKLVTMAKMTQWFERSQAAPWQLNTLKEKQITNMFNAITIFNISIDHITGIFKQSQNKSANCQADIQRALCP